MTRAIRSLVIALAFVACLTADAHAESPPDPLFDFKAIASDPLDAKVLKSSEKDGIVTEEFEFTSFVRDGKPDRVFGILAYPMGAKKLPAVFWSQSGMAPAGPYFPVVFAKKGYFCANVTLPHERRNSFAVFDTANPKQANLTLLALDQFRAITYMTQRPEVDPDRMMVCGSSYGGFFATLIAGADPRMKGGVAFFAAGNHELGTNLPQFTGLKSRDEIDIWNRTIDPAWRLKTKRVPFLWGVSANDNWFFPPAIAKTYNQAAGDCRIAIVPHWQHGFPENIDNELIDFADVVLAKTREPYNKPSGLKVVQRDGKLFAQWSWTGENKVKKAELVASYGEVKPWRHWMYRHHEILPARTEGNTATAELPVPHAGVAAYIYGNVIDERDVLTSTPPETIDTAKLGATVFSPSLRVNTATWGEFEADGIDFLARHGDPHGEVDTAVKHGGKQSIRLKATAGATPAPASITFKLCVIPGESHKLTAWVRSESATKVTATVRGASQGPWNAAVVLGAINPANAGAAKAAVYAVTGDSTGEWSKLELLVPAMPEGVDGYSLTITGDADKPATVWVDDVTFEAVWKK